MRNDVRHTPRHVLVLTDEAARHPFLASLPPHVRAHTKPYDPRAPWKLTADDMRGFASTYVACLLAALVFLL